MTESGGRPAAIPEVATGAPATSPSTAPEAVPDQRIAPEPTVPAVPALTGRGGRGRLSDRTLLRYGVRPFLAAADVAAFAIAVAPRGGPLGQDQIGRAHV